MSKRALSTGRLTIVGGLSGYSRYTPGVDRTFSPSRIAPTAPVGLAASVRRGPTTTTIKTKITTG